MGWQHSLEDLCKNLKKPRKVMLMVKAGDVVDQVDFFNCLDLYLTSADSGER